MKSNKNTYQLRQGEKKYILITSLAGETIKLVCNSFDQSFTREFTLDELRSLDQLFYEIKSSKEAIDFIDKALKIQKVGVKEKDGIVKLIFYITTKGIVHQIDIPLRKIGEKANFSDNNLISNEQQNAPNQIEEYAATNYTTTKQKFEDVAEHQKSENLENVPFESSNTNELLAEKNTKFDINQFLGQTTTNTNEFITGSKLETFNSLENITNTQDIVGLSSNNNELISNQNQNYDNLEFNEDNVNTNIHTIAELTTNEEISADNIMQTNVIETTSNIDQLVEGAANSKNEYFQTNIESNCNAESYMKTLPTKILSANFENIQSHYDTNSVPIPSFNTNQYMSNLESYQYTPTYDTTSIEPAVLPTPTLPIISDTEIASNDNIVAENNSTNAQYTIGQDFNLNQFTNQGSEGLETNEQLTNVQDLNLNQFTTEETTTNEENIKGQEFNFNQFTTGTTEGTETTDQFTTGQEFNLNQFTTGTTEGTETTEQFTTGQEFNLNQIGTESITNATNGQFETQEYATNKYTSNYNDQFLTQDFSTKQYNAESTNINTFDMKQSQEEVPPVPLTQLGDFVNQGYNFEGTSTQKYVEPQPTFTQPTLEQTNADGNLVLGSEENIFSSQVTFSLPKISAQPGLELQPQPTLDMNAYQEQPQQTQFDLTLFQEKSHYKVSEYKEPEYNIQEYTTTTPIHNTDDDRINKLEGDTNSLRNEHQQIQDKLNTLSGEINIYKNQLGAFEREKSASEVNALKAENMAIKQQLSELNNLRNTAAEVNVLRSQLNELTPLRKKAAEVELLKNQLRELNDLKAKVAELNMVKSQIGELDQLKAQISQMSNLKNELNTLRIQAADAENLRRKLEEMETAKIQQEQEIENLRNSQKIELLKMKTAGMGSDSKQISFEKKTKNITVKGDIIQNVNELEMLTRKINKMNKKITLNLLYKATVDSDKASAFHERCDDAKSSLVLVETDKGKRFGGFTTCSWRGDCIDKKDEEAFVFSLDKMMIYDNIPGEDAVGCYPKFGPIFLGCQIRIYDNAFTRGGTTFEKGLNFNTEEDFELTGGDRIFGVKEIEVYEVIV